MGIKYLNYTSISKKQRQAQGNRVLLSLRDALRNPALTSEQRAAIQAEIDNVNAWIAGSKPNFTPSVPEQT